MSDDLLPTLLRFMDKPCDDPALERFLTEQRIYERPKTEAQLEAEGYLDEHEDADDYELRRESEVSMQVQSERLGLCLIFEKRHDYALVYSHVPPGEAPFILNELAFFAKDVQIYQQYQGVLPGGLRFGIKRTDPRFQKLFGTAIASRIVHESVVDLYLIDNRIVNFGFDPKDESLIHVHIRNQNHFDAVMFNPRQLDAIPIPNMLGGTLIGQPFSTPMIQNFLLTHGVKINDEEPLGREITALTCSLGVTLYFKDTAQGQQLSAMLYKRRGDTGSQGYTGSLPMGFQFGDAPQTLFKKAGREYIKQTASADLCSFYWPQESGHLVQAMCSLIDWQLYRIFIHAPFAADSVLRPGN